MSYYTASQRNGATWAQPKPQYVDTKLGFSVGLYFDNETMRKRWAVIGPNDVWYFPNRYGMQSAKNLCRKLNKAES